MGTGFEGKTRLVTKTLTEFHIFLSVDYKGGKMLST